MTTVEGPPPAVAALHRAMPFTRLTDCGMDAADAGHLLATTAAGEEWEEVATRLGEAQHRRSLWAEGAGHLVTAREAARAATGAFVFAQMPRHRDDERKRALYARLVEAVTRTASLERPPLERLELPWADGRLVGWLALPPAATAQATVIV